MLKVGVCTKSVVYVVCVALQQWKYWGDLVMLPQSNVMQSGDIIIRVKILVWNRCENVFNGVHRQIICPLMFGKYCHPFSASEPVPWPDN